MSDENVYMRINHDWSLSYPARKQWEREIKIKENKESHIIFCTSDATEALRINPDLSITLNPNVPHDEIVKAVFESVSWLIQKKIEDEVEKRLKERDNGQTTKRPK